MKIEYDLIVVKVVNFLFYAGMACFMPYKAIFQKSIGLSSSQNGIIQALEKSITLVSPPLIGGFADKYSFHKSSMIICIMLSVAFTLPMYFIPSVDSSSNPVISCYQSTANVWCISDDSTFLEKCNNISLVNEDYSITCNDVYNVSMTLTCNIRQENDNVSNFNAFKPVMFECREQSIENEEFGSTFILVVVFTLFYAFFTNPVQPLIDATTMNMLGEGRMGDYGKQRLWGSIGFGSIALLIGFATDLYSKSKETSDEDYLFSFVGASVFGVLTSLVCWKLKVPKHNP
uniref:Major facilitator superfamily associated domain-containing protein n=1 Tax=Ciona savignyi TaxID=51511 RepID=H2YI68_CIOSA